MPSIQRIKGVSKVLANLRQRRQRAGKATNIGATVGYTQRYALHVHENLQARHKEGKQAKFLEQPAREMGSELGNIVSNAYRRGATLEQSLLLGALGLQRASQKIVPILTGALRASAFTALLKDEDAAARKSFAAGESLRRRKASQ